MPYLTLKILENMPLILVFDLKSVLFRAVRTSQFLTRDSVILNYTLSISHSTRSLAVGLTQNSGIIESPLRFLDNICTWWEKVIFRVSLNL